LSKKAEVFPRTFYWLLLLFILRMSLATTNRWTEPARPRGSGANKAKAGVYTTDVIGDMAEFCSKMAEAIAADVECPDLRDSPKLINAIARVTKAAGSVLTRRLTEQVAQMPSEEDFVGLIESLQCAPMLSTFELVLEIFMNTPAFLKLDRAKVLFPMLCDESHQKLRSYLCGGYELCAEFVCGMHEIASIVIAARGQTISSAWSPSTQDGARWWRELIAGELRRSVTRNLTGLASTNGGMCAAARLGGHADVWIKSQLDLRLDSDPRPPLQLPSAAMHRNLRHFVLRVRDTAAELTSAWDPEDFSGDTMERMLKKPAGRLARYLAGYTERQYAKYYIFAMIDDILMRGEQSMPPSPLPIPSQPARPVVAAAPIANPPAAASKPTVSSPPKKRGRPPTKKRSPTPVAISPLPPTTTWPIAVVDLTRNEPLTTPLSPKGKEPHLIERLAASEDDCDDIIDSSDDTRWTNYLITNGTGRPSTIAGDNDTGSSSARNAGTLNPGNGNNARAESEDDGEDEDAELRERLDDCPITMDDLRKKDDGFRAGKFKNPMTGYSMCDRCARLAFYKCTMDICKTYNYCTNVFCACCFETSFAIGNAGLSWNPMLQTNSSPLYTGRMSIKLCDDCKSSCSHGWQLGADGELERQPPKYKAISSARGCKLCPAGKSASGKRPREDTVCYECRECDTKFCSRVECDPDRKFLREVYLPMEDRFITRAILRLPPEAQDLARLALADAENDISGDGPLVPAAGVGCKLPRSIMERKILPLELNLRCLCKEYHGTRVHKSEADSCLAKFLIAVHAVAAEDLKIRDRWMNGPDKGARLGGTLEFNAPKRAMTYQMFAPKHNGHQVIGLGLNGEDVFVGLINMRAIATNDSELMSIVERMRANDGYTDVDSDPEDAEPPAKRQCTPQSRMLTAGA